MGTFCGSIHLQTEDHVSVCNLLGPLAKRKCRFLVSPAAGGWVSVFPSGHGQDDKVSKRIAKKYSGNVLHLALHDDDVLYYWLYQNRKLIDKFSSCPDYFKPLTERAKARWKGKPELLAPLLDGSSDLPSIRELLDGLRAQPLFTSDLPHRFTTALGIMNAWTSYEYLMDGETDGIEGWDRFIHIPDLSEEQRKKQQTREGIVKQKRLLEQEGILLLEHSRGGKVTTFPVVTASRSGLGFHVCWPVDGQSIELETCEAPWSEITPSGMQLTPNVYVMTASSSGKYLATGHASGTWQATLWDLEQQTKIADIDQPRLVSCVGFAADERELISLSENHVTVAEIPSGRMLAEFACDKMQGSNIAGAIHQQSHKLVLGGQLGLTILDLDSARGGYTVRVMKQDPMIIIRDHMHELGLDFGDLTPDEITPQILKEAATKALEKQLGQKLTGRIPQFPVTSQGEQVRRLAFSPDEKLLFCAVMGGVRVYDWSNLCKPSDAISVPVLFADATPAKEETDQMSMTMTCTYAMAHDEADHKLLFAGLGGKIEFLDLESGDIGTVLTIPGQPAILDMCFNADRTALCCVCQPSFFDRRPDTPPLVQAWDYGKLKSNVENTTVQ